MVVDGDLVRPLNDKLHSSTSLDRDFIRDEKVNVSVERSQIRISIQRTVVIRSPQTKAHRCNGQGTANFLRLLL
jgi:hypothetical protein